jgi:hypothetical protein
MRRPMHRSLITLQPAGKGRAPSLTAVIRPRLPGGDERSEIVLWTISAKNAAPVARLARPSGQCPDLTRVKSGKQERARHAPTGSPEPHHALAGC